MEPFAPLQIVYMGTPDFAVPSLEILHNSHHQVQAVVTVPDKQAGRGRKQQASAVKVAALELGLPVLQPEKLTAPEFLQELKVLAPDLIVVVAFRILPEAVFSLPRFGSFNLHASLLPKYRGAAPIHWALLNGEQETGVTTFFLKKSVDTGNIIRQRSVNVAPADNLHSLYAKLCATGADLVLETVDIIAQGKASAGQQDDTQASPAPKVTTETRRLDFSEPAQRCHNRIRAFAPSPGAFTERQGKMLKLLRSQVVEAHGEPGSVVSISPQSFTIACGAGALEVLSVQPESKKAMDSASYLRGYPFEIGEVLG